LHHAANAPETPTVHQNCGVSITSLANPGGIAVGPTGDVAISDLGNHRVKVIETPVPIVTSVTVKVSPVTGKAKLIVEGYGMLDGNALVAVDGQLLGTFRYKLLVGDLTARRVIATDVNFDGYIPTGTRVLVTVANQGSSLSSAPIPFTRLH